MPVVFTLELGVHAFAHAARGMHGLDGDELDAVAILENLHGRARLQVHRLTDVFWE
jgi:hypothetical protein